MQQINESQYCRFSQHSPASVVCMVPGSVILFNCRESERNVNEKAIRELRLTNRRLRLCGSQSKGGNMTKCVRYYSDNSNIYSGIYTIFTILTIVHQSPSAFEGNGDFTLRWRRQGREFVYLKNGSLTIAYLRPFSIFPLFTLLSSSVNAAKTKIKANTSKTPEVIVEGGKMERWIIEEQLNNKW